MARKQPTRRHVLRASGATIAGVTLAGCTGRGDENPDEQGNGGDENTDDSDDFDGWFDDVPNFEGVEDLTGEDEVTVDVGAGSDGYLFEPAAIRVSTGTTVVWEWTGEGGAHDVTAEDGTFESELTSDAGATFEHTFDEAGTYEYVCTPHESMGMKGAVVVE